MGCAHRATRSPWLSKPALTTASKSAYTTLSINAIASPKFAFFAHNYLPNRNRGVCTCFLSTWQGHIFNNFLFCQRYQAFCFERLWLPRVRINGGVCFLGHGSTEATLRMGVLLIKWCAISLRLPTHWSTWFHFHYIYIICMFVCVCLYI